MKTLILEVLEQFVCVCVCVKVCMYMYTCIVKLKALNDSSECDTEDEIERYACICTHKQCPRASMSLH